MAHLQHGICQRAKTGQACVVNLLPKFFSWNRALWKIIFTRCQSRHANDFYLTFCSLFRLEYLGNWGSYGFPYVIETCQQWATLQDDLPQILQSPRLARISLCYRKLSATVITTRRPASNVTTTAPSCYRKMTSSIAFRRFSLFRLYIHMISLVDIYCQLSISIFAFRIPLSVVDFSSEYAFQNCCNMAHLWNCMCQRDEIMPGHACGVHLLPNFFSARTEDLEKKFSLAAKVYMETIFTRLFTLFQLKISRQSKLVWFSLWNTNLSVTNSTTRWLGSNVATTAPSCYWKMMSLIAFCQFSLFLLSIPIFSLVSFLVVEFYSVCAWSLFRILLSVVDFPRRL